MVKGIVLAMTGAAVTGALAADPLPRLRDLAGDRFLIGMSLSDRLTADDKDDPLGLREIINYHANTSTCENALKWRHLQPQPGPIDFSRADAYVAYCEKNGLWPVGHTLIWDLKTPDWVFKDMTREQLLERMRTHIHTVVGRYKGRIKLWDVVNEAIAGSGRFNDSPWRRIIGPDYIEHAFRFAHEADPDALLYYNDNHMFLPRKRDTVVEMIRQLKAAGVRIDGIGMQGHFFTIKPDFENVERSIVAFAKEGMRVAFTEVDISVLPAAWDFVDQDINDLVGYSDKLNPYTNGLPAEVESQLTDSYGKLFRLFVKHADKIDRVTFWCVTDADSWLNYRPIAGRTDYPLLFDRKGQPKAAFHAVVDAMRMVPAVQGGESAEALGRRFFPLLLADEASLASRPHLRDRAGLLAAAALARQQDWPGALTAFRDYFMRKLADAPMVLGYPEDLADPATDYNGAFKALITTDPAGRAAAIAAADRLLASQPEAEANTPPWGGGFAFPLLQAYVYTGKRPYIERWCDLMDDWALNDRYLEGLRPLYMEPGDAKGAAAAFQMMRLLRAVAMASPEARAGMRPETLARVLAKLMRTYTSTTWIYHNANPRNWINENAFFLCWMGALWDEFREGEVTLEHGRIMFERYGSTHVLPDGTEIQRLIGYNFMYFNDGIRTVRLLESLYPDAARSPRWKRDLMARRWGDEQRALLRDRVRYLVRMSTPDRGLPIGMRGDYRELGFQGFRDGMPSVMAEPDTGAIIGALTHPKKQPAGLPPASDAFPWGGYFWQREGWGAGNGHAFMVNNPLIGDNGFMGRCANNAFGLNMYGMDMLEIGVEGVYSIRPCPLLVDGFPQNLNAGVYLTDMEPSAPINSRWHAADGMDLAETLYKGPYARNLKPEDPSGMAALYQQAIKDVAHRRQLVFLKKARLWICIDRLHTGSARSYELTWRLPSPPASKAGVKTFAHDAIRLHAALETMHTQAEGQPNLSLYHVGGVPLKLAKRDAKIRETRLTNLTEVRVSWKGTGDQVVATLIHPRPDMATELRQYERIQGKESIGFDAVTPAGIPIGVRAARQGAAALVLGTVTAQAELLVLQGDVDNLEGMLLGGSALAFGGRPVVLERPDVHFTVRDGNVVLTPVLEPVQPVEVLPARQGFAGVQPITLQCRTPGVELRYTLDGSEPSPRSALYSGPFTITASTVLRARAYRPGQTVNPPELSGRRASPPVWAYYEKLEPAAPVVAAALDDGLWCARYAGHWLDMVQRLDTLAVEEHRPVGGLFEKWSGVPAPETFRPAGGGDAAPAPPAYGLRYSGYIEVPEDGVYTLHAPPHYMRDNLAAGYALTVKVAGQAWSPVMRRHGFGTWSVALQKGPHSFEVDYVDYRGSAVADWYHPDLRVNWIWHGAAPDLRISGPGLEEQRIPSGWLRRPVKMLTPQ